MPDVGLLSRLAGMIYQWCACRCEQQCHHHDPWYE